MKPLLKLIGSDHGQDIAEYAVMLAVILVLVVGTIRLVGSNANTVFRKRPAQFSKHETGVHYPATIRPFSQVEWETKTSESRTRGRICLGEHSGPDRGRSPFLLQSVVMAKQP